MTPAERLSGRSPSDEEIYEIARRTLERLPPPFADSLDDVVLQIEELADDEIISELELDDPMELSGLYEGVPMHRRSVDQSGTLPEKITLYSRPIVEEWRSTRVSLEQLVAHVLIHEIGHHFGLSDEDMHALEDAIA